MKPYIITYLATFIVMAILDLTWLGGVARGFYKERMGDLLEVQLVPALVFYVVYVLGIMVFVNPLAHEEWKTALFMGAAFGFFAYATYDLTNLATLRGWSLSLSIADIAWGTFVTGVSAAAGRYIAKMILQG